MDACENVEREIDKVISKFTSIHDHCEDRLKDLHNHLLALKQEMDNAPENHVLTHEQHDIMRRTMAKLREIVQRISAEHRDLHSTVSKVGKAIDRNFVADFSATTKEDVFSAPDKVEILNKVMCQHFYRQGVIDVAVELAKEAGIQTEQDASKSFTEINTILESLRKRELGPALEWAENRRESLQEHNSSLEFKLHRLHFIGLLQGGVVNQAEAIRYARAHFPKFIERFETDIQHLMGMLLFLPSGLATSPYHAFLDPSQWTEIYDIFTRDACALMGLSVDSPLAVSVNVGCNALPALLNIKQVMIQRQVSGLWNGKEELPIEIDLGPNHRYHSVFACPILRAQSSDSNPPMRLVCGHVISRDALTKLILPSGNKLKCPYCPLEQSPNEARIVYF